MQLYISVNHKIINGDTYRQVLKYPDFAACQSLTDGTDNIAVKVFLDLFKVLVGELLDSCSRSGTFKSWNVTLQGNTFLETWPAGDYATLIRIFDEIDDNVFNVTFTASLVK